MKVAFFPGCMVDMIYPEVGIAAVNVLERLGCEVEMPEEQVCCGQGLINSGYRKEMVPAARMIVDAYETSEYVGAITGGEYGVGEQMRKDEFEQAVDIEFEGHPFKTFSCWDSYLTGLYGDYMTPPPNAGGHTHFVSAWIDDEQSV